MIGPTLFTRSTLNRPSAGRFAPRANRCSPRNRCRPRSCRGSRRDPSEPRRWPSCATRRGRGAVTIAGDGPDHRAKPGLDRRASAAFYRTRRGSACRVNRRRSTAIRFVRRVHSDLGTKRSWCVGTVVIALAIIANPLIWSRVAPDTFVVRWMERANPVTLAAVLLIAHFTAFALLAVFRSPAAESDDEVASLPIALAIAAVLFSLLTSGCVWFAVVFIDGG